MYVAYQVVCGEGVFFSAEIADNGRATLSDDATGGNSYANQANRRYVTRVRMISPF